MDSFGDVFDLVGKYGDNALIVNPRVIVLAVISQFRNDPSMSDRDVALEICAALGAIAWDNHLKITGERTSGYSLEMHPLKFQKCDNE